MILFWLQWANVLIGIIVLNGVNAFLILPTVASGLCSLMLLNLVERSVKK